MIDKEKWIKINLNGLRFRDLALIDKKATDQQENKWNYFTKFEYFFQSTHFPKIRDFKSPESKYSVSLFRVK